MARYIVEFCKFSDGSWYVKTETDSAGAAASVATCNNFGRVARVIDTERDSITIYDDQVDWENYEKNGVDIESIIY